MANICLNCLTIEKVDKSLLERLSNMNKLGLCKSLYPLLECDNFKSVFGIKYDIDEIDHDYIEESNIAYLRFSTPWCPPIELYNLLVKDGYKIEAYYYECGCDFCGEYNNGIDKCYSISEQKFDCQHIIDMFVDEEEYIWYD